MEGWAALWPVILNCSPCPFMPLFSLQRYKRVMTVILIKIQQRPPLLASPPQSSACRAPAKTPSRANFTALMGVTPRHMCSSTLIVQCWSSPRSPSVAVAMHMAALAVATLMPGENISGRSVQHVRLLGGRHDWIIHSPCMLTKWQSQKPLSGVLRLWLGLGNVVSTRPSSFDGSPPLFEHVPLDSFVIKESRAKPSWRPGLSGSCLVVSKGSGARRSIWRPRLSRSCLLLLQGCLYPLLLHGCCFLLQA